MLNLLSIFIQNVSENVNKALTIMWQGVLAVFIVIAIIICLTYLLNKITAPKKDDKKEDNENE